MFVGTTKFIERVITTDYPFLLLVLVFRPPSSSHPVFTRRKQSPGPKGSREKRSRSIPTRGSSLRGTQHPRPLSCFPISPSSFLLCSSVFALLVMDIQRQFPGVHWVWGGGISFVYEVHPLIVVKVPKSGQEERERFRKELKIYEILSRHPPCPSLVECFHYTTDGIFLEYMRD
ncbi:hypothetical protein CIHG_10088, partial [Coccidioides immitis H538.4]